MKDALISKAHVISIKHRREDCEIREEKIFK